MDETLPGPSPTDPGQEPAPCPPRRKGWPVLAWVVILCLVGLIVWRNQRRPVEGSPTAEDPAGYVAMQIQARVLIGLQRWPGQTGTGLFEHARPLDTGPVGQRLRFVVLAGELAGPDEARRQLEQLRRRLDERGIEPTDRQDAVAAALGRLYRADGPALDPSDRELLREELGWFGKLALAHPQGPDGEAREAILQSARRTMIAYLVILGVGALLALVGLLTLVVLLVLIFTRKTRFGLRCGILHGGVYAETFAVWMLLYLGLGLASALVPLPVPPLLGSGLAMLLSLVVLGWPVLRGVPWSQVRADLGLTAGRRPWLEPLFGPLGNLVAVFFMSVALLATAILLAAAQAVGVSGDPAEVFGPGSQPSHPVMEMLSSPTFLEVLQLLFLASVVAPVVEEVMFRGVLYRHLREATGRVGVGSSLLLSAAATSLLFAAIHPQGLLAVPGLAAIAVALTLIREWRGTLVPCMVMHGIHNAVLLALALLLLQA